MSVKDPPFPLSGSLVLRGAKRKRSEKEISFPPSFSRYPFKRDTISFHPNFHKKIEARKPKNGTKD